jgi:predicted nucleic acid-binding Zn ribbon protein
VSADREVPTSADPCDSRAEGPVHGAAELPDSVEAGEGGPGRGPALARDALVRAQAGAEAARRERDRGAAARRRAATGPVRRRRPADGADPVAFGAAIDDLLAARGWTGEAAVVAVTARWGETVGAGIAEHCTPLRLHEGVLTVEAESTAWATQLRLLSRTLLARIAEVAGPGVVTRLVVHGPVSPSWGKGRLRVPGRGPRDTYG